VGVGDKISTAPGPGIKPRKSASLPSRQWLYNPESWPGVFYECNAALEFAYVSENSAALLGLESRELIGSPLLSEQRIPIEDLKQLSKRVNELEQLGKTTVLIHRMLNGHGLPLWVTHSFSKASANNATVVRGYLVPIDYDGRLGDSDQAISRFVHKIGNHFQLLNLVVNSLKRTLPECKETSMLQETVEKAIDLTRGFSEYHQVPTCLSQVELLEVLQATVITRRSSFEAKKIVFESQIHQSLKGVTVHADPYLLELAMGHILQNALEATDAGGYVTLGASVKSSSTAAICVTDSGCGIDENTLPNVLVPFFSSKKNHEGLGLSMASRFIEMHGGILRIISALGKGTEVHILLPTETENRPRPA
jgi:signal transduction histidine kinase